MTQKNTLLSGLFTATSHIVISGFIIGITTVSQAQSVGSLDIPTGGNVVSGSASISSPSAGQLNINQTTDRAIIEWNNFNIGQNATTEFFQPSSSSLAVNKITGSIDPTQILGTLKSNGQLMILDPNGVMVGNNAIIDVGGIIASTGNISNTEVMSGSPTITLLNVDANGSIINNGSITAKTGGLVALIAPNVSNNGVITARLGRVEMVAGDQVTIDLFGDSLVEIAINGMVANALLSNSGSIIADGGRIAMTAATASSIIDNAINMSGTMQAQSVGIKNGQIVFSGGDNIKATISGSIDATGQDAGTTGGIVNFKTGHIDIQNGSIIDVSGDAGGGNVFVGGTIQGATNSAHTVTLAENAEIKADAYNNGDGGNVVLWSDEYTDFSGDISARGGSVSGDGGFIEVSGLQGLLLNGLGDTTALNGDLGIFFIDPVTFSIWNQPSATTATTNFVNADVLSIQLSFNSVQLQADSDVNILDNLDLSSSIFGSTIGDFIINAPLLNINHDIKMGSGNFGAIGDTLNLSGRILNSDNTLRGLAWFNSFATGPTTVNVMGNTASIQQAIDMSATGSTVNINVAAGNYVENLDIHKSISLIGDPSSSTPTGIGATAPKISGAFSGGTMMTINSDDVTISGFNFDGSINGNLNSRSNYSVFSNGYDNLTITDNHHYNTRKSAIVVKNGNNITISRNSFNHIWERGIELNNVSVATLDGNSAFANSSDLSTDLFGTNWDTIYVINSDQISVLNTSITGENGGFGSCLNGVFFDNVTNSIISGTIVTGQNGGNGVATSAVRVQNSNNITIDNNSIIADGVGSIGTKKNSGIYVKNSSATISNNTISAINGGHAVKKGHGIFAKSSNSVQILNNTIESKDENSLATSLDGIRVEDSVNSIIDGNDIAGRDAGTSAWRDGISILRSHNSVIRNNRAITKNGGIATGNDGFLVTDSNNVVLNNNQIISEDIVVPTNLGQGVTTRHGINITDSAGTTVSQNFISSNFGGTGTGGDGIFANNSLNLNILNNTVRGGSNQGTGSYGDAIHIINSNNLTISDNIVDIDITGLIGANGDGIHLENSNNQTITNNQIDSVVGNNVNIE